MVQTKIVSNWVNPNDEKVELIFDKDKILEWINLGIEALNISRGTDIVNCTDINFYNTNMYLSPFKDCSLSYSSVGWILSGLDSIESYFSSARKQDKNDSRYIVTKIDFTSFTQKDIIKFVKMWMTRIWILYKNHRLYLQ